MIDAQDWFETYVTQTSRAAGVAGQPKLGNRILCPCCHFPTLAERAAWNICRVCWWEDDGQDDATADAVWGGPNGHYSLTQARANFDAHRHMYEAGTGIEIVETPTADRTALLTYVGRVQTGQDVLDMAVFLPLLKAA